MELAMGPKDFAVACRDERDALLAAYTQTSTGTAVARHVAAAALSDGQRKHVIAAIDAALTDAFYTILLALDGSGSLGGTQQPFVLKDESGDTIANGDGQLEAEAWHALQADK